MARLAGIKNFLNSLTGRMALGVLLIHALLAPLMFGGMLFIVKQAYEAQFINHVRSEARLIATLAERDLDIPDLRVHLDDVLLGSTIVYAQVVKEDGSIYYQSGTAPDEFKEDFFLVTTTIPRITSPSRFSTTDACAPCCASATMNSRSRSKSATPIGAPLIWAWEHSHQLTPPRNGTKLTLPRFSRT